MRAPAVCTLMALNKEWLLPERLENGCCIITVSLPVVKAGLTSRFWNGALFVRQTDKPQSVRVAY